MKKLLFATALVVLGFGLAIGVWVRGKYQTASDMAVPLREFSSAEYPEDPAGHSSFHNRYRGRSLKLVDKGSNRFDFIFESTNSRVAKVIFKDIDVALMVPRIPESVRNHEGNTLIALTDREWNRQQVAFKATSPHVEVSGGDGFEKKNLFSAELANNCLNAGLWEVLLFTEEGGQKALYYQGWFTFPRGHYARIFEANNQLPYKKYWHRLEHWRDPAGTVVDVAGLRTVQRDLPATISFLADENVFVAGEQKRKMRTLNAQNVVKWGDFYDGRTVQFASFVKPGRYDVGTPWKNEYWRIGKFKSGTVRSVVSRLAQTNQTLHELELAYTDSKNGDESRLIIGGIDLTALPQLETIDYAKGLYLPMGIGVPPFYQSHDDLQKSPPHLSPYYNVLLDSQQRWIDHHRLALDGIAAHRDKQNPKLVHLYLLSYERNTVIGHYTVNIDGTTIASR